MNIPALKYFALLLSGGSVLLVSGVTDESHARRVAQTPDWIVQQVQPVTYAQWRELNALPKDQRFRYFAQHVQPVQATL